jgi:hypothetical protein
MFNKDNIIAGIGSVVDLFGTRSSNRYRNSSDEHKASSDYDALKSDWITIGNDISQAVELFVSRYGDTIKNGVRIDD